MTVMPLSVRTHRFRPRRIVVLAAIGAAIAITTAARADTVTVADMLRGINKTADQCAATPQAVWVNAMGRNYCMRYYLASGSSDQRRPILFLQGDRLGVLNLRTGTFAVPDGEKDINTDNLMRFASLLARENKGTAIYLGRVGIEGSSGDHRVRHSVLELQATNAALDAIKQRHGFEGFHLLGQSGGAHLVAGLLGLRQDIGCAVIGSGPLAPRRRPNLLADPALEHFNPLGNLEPIVRNRSARIMVVTDPADKKVSSDKQTEFVRTLERAGRAVEHYMVQAIDDNRHGVVSYSRLAMLGCLRNANSQDIALQIDRLVKARVAAAKQQPAKRNDASRDGPLPSGDGHGHQNNGQLPQRSAPAPVPERAPESIHR
jgi:hypothetical protein